MNTITYIYEAIGQFSGADILWVVPMLVKIDAAAFEVKMTNHSQDHLLKEFQQQLTIPLNKQTFLSNTRMEKSISHFFLKRSIIIDK